MKNRLQLCFAACILVKIVGCSSSSPTEIPPDGKSVDARDVTAADGSSLSSPSSNPTTLQKSDRDDVPIRVSAAGKGDAEQRRNIPTIQPARIIPAEIAKGSNQRIAELALSPNGSFLVIVGANKKQFEVRCLDLASGELMWTVPSSKPLGAVGCSNEYVFVDSNFQNSAMAISLADGKIISRGSLAEAMKKQIGPIVIDEKKMQATFFKQGLVTVDLRTGEHTYLPWPKDFWGKYQKPATAAYLPEIQTFVVTGSPNHWATWEITEEKFYDGQPIELDGKKLRWQPTYGLTGHHVFGKSSGIRLIVDVDKQQFVQTSEDSVSDAMKGIPVELRSNRIALSFDCRGVSSNGSFAILATRMGLEKIQQCVVYDVGDVENPEALAELEYDTTVHPVQSGSAEYISSRGSQISNDGKTISFQTEFGNIVVFRR